MGPQPGAPVFVQTKTCRKEGKRMGQRLNIELQHNQETIANIYYHFGNYTSSAVYLLDSLATALIACKPKNPKAAPPPVSGLMRAMAATGAGISTDDWVEILKDDAELAYKWANKDLDFLRKYRKSLSDTDLDKVNRNNGLIGLTWRQIEETQNSAEGAIYVNLDSYTAEFGCVFEHQPDEDLDGNGAKNGIDAGTMEIPDDIDIYAIPLDKVSCIAAALAAYKAKNEQNLPQHWRLPSGQLVDCIN